MDFLIMLGFCGGYSALGLLATWKLGQIGVVVLVVADLVMGMSVCSASVQRIRKGDTDGTSYMPIFILVSILLMLDSFFWQWTGEKEGPLPVNFRFFLHAGIFINCVCLFVPGLAEYLVSRRKPET